jgi:hypothetical protein
MTTGTVSDAQSQAMTKPEAMREPQAASTDAAPADTGLAGQTSTPGAGRTTAPGAGRASVAYYWGLAGVICLFAFAVYRLGMRGVITVAGGLAAWEWVSLAVLTVAFVYGEGVRALQRRWVPWVIGRLHLLDGDRRTWYRALAPLHAMAFIGAPPKLMAAAWAGSIAIFLAVLIVSSFPDPWRGIVDFAVASALLWATLVLAVQGVRRRR